jgi:uncharacterized membrane protein YdfJ with MMPL/SSD domain
MEHKSIAARAGHWSATHRRKAILGWLAFVVVAVVLGGLTGMKAPDDFESPGEAGRAEAIIHDAFPERASERVIVQGTGPEADAAFEAVVAAVRGREGVQELRTDQATADGTSRLVTFELAAEPENADELAEPIIEAVERVGRDHPGVYVGQFGDASANIALSEAFADDFRKAETLSIPLTLVILVLAFGALVAAGVPLLLGVSAVAATIGIVSLISQLFPVGEMIGSIVLLIGMAVGVDYTLFYLRREREERRRGASHEEAVSIAAATSGRAVLVSGLTVMVAMAGMFLAGERTFVELGIGAIIVVGVAMVGSLTVVPATLAALKHRVDKGRVPFVHRLQRPDGSSRAWNAVLGAVLRRPVASAALATGALLLMASPALHMKTANAGMDDLPRDLPVMQAYDRMQEAFPGGGLPAVVAARGEGPEFRAAVERLAAEAPQRPSLNGPVQTTWSADRSTAIVTIPMDGNGNDDASMAGLREVREVLVPSTVGAVDGAEAAVTGITAGSKDFTDKMAARMPVVVGFVLALAFVLLLVTFRSLVVPVKAIVLNLLSVAAAYGVLVWVFQDGHLEGLLDFERTGFVTAWLPMFLFVVLFGLSMDYHVFILSRVREAWRGGMRTDEAVKHGITATAGTVTSAALVMVAVFGVFATLSSIEFKMMGVGLATAILIDATIVRAVLLPATMKLLGDANWYLPRWLDRRLPQVDHEGAVPAPPELPVERAPEPVRVGAGA